MKRNTNRYPGLYREISSDGTVRFRILINHNKEVIQQYFYAGAKRTEAAAKKAALERWREIRKVIPVLTKRTFREVPRKPNSSGIPGVNRVTTYSKGHEYEVWRATWTTLRGARGTKQFSIKKYGTREAKRLAMECRREALDKVGKA